MLDLLQVESATRKTLSGGVFFIRQKGDSIMDIAAFTNAVVSGVPLIFVIMGLVQFAKKLGAAGKALIIISMAIGLLLGAGYQFATVGFPVNFAGWFGVVVYGLGLGVVASGVYDAATTAIKASRG